MARSISPFTPLLLAVALVVTACGNGGIGSDTSTTVIEPTSTTTSPSTTTTSPETTTTTEAPTTTTTTVADLPGEPFGMAPAEGATMAVVGVAFDDVLNLRAAPGTDQPIVSELAPTQADMVATGRARILRQTVWFELDDAGTVGWASARFLGYLGDVVDLTSEVVAGLGEIPIAPTMVDLGLVVAEELGVDEAEASSRITVTVAPTEGDLGEVTYDVVGLLDDSLLGYRLHVFGATDPSTPGFSLKSVEATLLCARGMATDGLCP